VELERKRSKRQTKKNHLQEASILLTLPIHER